MVMTREGFIDAHSDMFWYTPEREKRNISDELLVETALDELKEVMKIVKNCMESAADLPVSLSVDVKNGESWYDCH